MEPERDPVRQLDGGEGAPLDVLGIEDQQVAPILGRAVDDPEQEAIPFAGIGAVT
jgi:hypothetical protein